MDKKWGRFSSRHYALLDLGRPAVFLIPKKKLKINIRQMLHMFLIKNFGAYTSSTIPGFGFWKDTDKATISDECVEYEVSFLGKERIPTLIKKLAEIASLIDEECIYLKTGQYACLIYPKKPQK